MSDLPLTTANAQQYGQSCFDFAATLPTCELPQTLPPNLTPNCQAFVQTRFSHNGCVDAHQRDPDFLRGSWRTFLGQNRNIWHDAHDVIRLLDADGRVVDVLSY
jgi:hypothetical protein